MRHPDAFCRSAISIHRNDTFRIEHLHTRHTFHDPHYGSAAHLNRGSHGWQCQRGQRRRIYGVVDGDHKITIILWSLCLQLNCYTAMKAMKATKAITQIPIEAITIIMHHKLSLQILSSALLSGSPLGSKFRRIVCDSHLNSWINNSPISSSVR